MNNFEYPNEDQQMHHQQMMRGRGRARGRGRGRGGMMRMNPQNDPAFFDKMQLKYEQEKQMHIQQGAECDPSNGSIIRKANRSDKIKAKGRKGNIALDVDRPELPICTFSDLKSDLQNKEFNAEKLQKPQI